MASTDSKKLCRQCGNTQPLSNFVRRRRGDKVFHSECRSCHNAEARRHRSRNPERYTLAEMIRRCHDPRHSAFRHYGGRGISVCDNWRSNPGGFEEFFAHVGPRPSVKHSIDRIDNNGNYEPGNVRWSTQLEQNRNTRTAAKITAFGKTQCIAAWSEETGIHMRTLSERIKRWGTERALTTPISKRHRENRLKGRRPDRGQEA